MLDEEDGEKSGDEDEFQERREQKNKQVCRKNRTVDINTPSAGRCLLQNVTEDQDDGKQEDCETADKKKQKTK